MAANKKPPVKKAKAPARKAVIATAARSSRKQPAKAAPVTAEQEMLTLVLAAMFTILSVLFAVITYWRYQV